MNSWISLSPSLRLYWLFYGIWFTNLLATPQLHCWSSGHIKRLKNNFTWVQLCFLASNDQLKSTDYTVCQHTLPQWHNPYHSRKMSAIKILNRVLLRLSLCQVILAQSSSHNKAELYNEQVSMVISTQIDWFIVTITKPFPGCLWYHYNVSMKTNISR